MSRALVAAGVLLSAVFATSVPAAHANCGDVPTEGRCEDLTTLAWCDGVDVRRITCPGNEICVRHELFGGAPGCIAPNRTDCGDDITEAGQCTVTNSVVWCDAEGVPRNERCSTGTMCSWDEDNGGYDCLGGRRHETPVDEADTSDGDAAIPDPSREQDGAGSDDTASGPAGPTPGLAFDEDPGPVAGGDAACSSARGPAAAGWWLVVCGACLMGRASLRRRRLQ